MSWHPTFLQLLWDLELLTGAGLGLFWPPWPQFCGLRAQVQHAQHQHSKPHSRTDDNSERLSSGVSWGSAERRGGGVSETLGHSQWSKSGRNVGFGDRSGFRSLL